MGEYINAFSVGFTNDGRPREVDFRRNDKLMDSMTSSERKIAGEIMANTLRTDFGLTVFDRADPKSVAQASSYKPRDDEPIRWDQPLYDSDGYEHSLVALGGIEAVTRLSFVYVIWNRKTGECLREDANGLTLSNEKPRRERQRG